MNANCTLGLGTAQWGLHYGLANQAGVTPAAVVTEILAEAARAGVVILDTASLYGQAESVLGTHSLGAFRIVSKTPKFDASHITDEHAYRLMQAFDESLYRLSSSRIYGLLAHHADDLLAPGGGKLIAAMLELREKGKVEKIGVSVYTGAQVDDILQIFRPDIVQLPLSILDQRMLSNGQLERLKARGIEVHTRSVFLQGLLLLPLSKVPAYFDPIRPILRRWHAAAAEQGMTAVQAALSFVRNTRYVDTVLVGVETKAQFQSCLRDFNSPTHFDAKNLGCSDQRFVNPMFWKNPQ